MKFGDIPLAEAEGAILAHAVRLDKAVFKKGRVLSPADVAHLESALSLNPKATAAHYPLSQAYAALGDTAKSAEHLSQRRDGRIAPRDTLMVELDALLQSPQSFETLGIRRLDEENWPGAAEMFRKGIALAPDGTSMADPMLSMLHKLGHDDMTSFGDSSGTFEI